MQDAPIDFPITAQDKVSMAFRDLGIHSFAKAARFVQHLPYARNANKHEPLTVLTDGHGTCSSKHALLKMLADEHDQHTIQLMIGLFRMNGRNTPAVRDTLERHRLDHIPEAHCYLKYNGTIMDHTRSGSSASDFVADLIEEQAITPDQITDFKVDCQRGFMSTWVAGLPHKELTLEQVWRIREQCIQDLATGSRTIPSW